METYEKRGHFCLRQNGKQEKFATLEARDKAIAELTPTQTDLFDETDTEDLD